MEAPSTRGPLAGIAGIDRWNGTMHLAAAFAAGHLAARATDRRFRTTETEIREAQERVAARRAELVAAQSARRGYAERGRHAAPRPA
ncbi:hypothetical protein [Agromyces sp. NPDC058126]|uniref:hypothetical protein n=1 Tax=Agromyces sp. NPDC058126 TaxID=3346350 RepID=UPI0036DF396A